LATDWSINGNKSRLVLGKESRLFYIRTKDGAEVDFAITQNNQVQTLLECKLSDTQPHKALIRFAQELKPEQAIQLVRNARHDDESRAVKIKRAAPWLAALE
jgi:uncharacterized protein